MRPRIVALLLAAVVPLLVGCVSTTVNSPAEVRVAASWGPWGYDDPVPHLILEIRNEGGQGAVLDAQAVRVTGPTGLVPLQWEPPGGPNLGPGEATELVLHPRAFPDGRTGLALDHAWGTPVALPEGLYAACVRGACASADLGA